jgi:integrase/recombinase XerD
VLAVPLAVPCYQDILCPKRRSELSSLEKKPSCIIGIKQIKRKEKSCYKPSDLWTEEDDLVFLKWVTNRRDRCYHAVARDLSARPHEILNLKIKDVVSTAGNKQYAKVLVNGKTGSRPIPLIQSIPYLKEWLSNHPSRNNPNSPLFIGLGRNSMGKQLSVDSLYGIYKHYKASFQSCWKTIQSQMKIKKRLRVCLLNYLIHIYVAIVP